MAAPVWCLLSTSDELLARLLSDGLKLVVTPSEQVIALQAQVSELQDRLEGLQAEYYRVEYRYRCGCIINQRLQDYCRECGLPVPHSTYEL